ncbi:NYN domain-containing protein [Tissierella sp. Yu-01]|uniref:NYN domain-containing protein n=1 Tax=Tissierella sp. Yu-01 TaxID=3035694 RepID=UPI00240D488F|nr:NYN domain-containing protein [Tissierella sp. Yu-01]WFA07675.1 NYN domain-containing protein [Tissierella sp. Yu-01]
MKKKSKIREYLFVDGYNIINSWEILKAKAQISLEEARIELLEILSEYQHYSGIVIIVVFDAHQVKGNSGTREDYKGLKVIYTKENETADNYIERVLDDIGRIKRVRVATSDWMEQQIVLSRGGTRISARELEVEIYNEKRMMKMKRKSINQKNDIQIGKLDEKTIIKLKDWFESEG